MKKPFIEKIWIIMFEWRCKPAGWRAIGPWFYTKEAAIEYAKTQIVDDAAETGVTNLVKRVAYREVRAPWRYK